MKYRIKVVSVGLKGQSAFLAEQSGAAHVTTTGVVTTTYHWLTGENPWGLHQDVAFSAPNSAVKQGMRIMDAAEAAANANEPYIDLRREDYEVLMRVVSNPQQHPNTIPKPAAFSRALLPILEEIEKAEVVAES
jgi:hypothetical protein